MTDAQKEKLLEKHVAALSEHFGAVQIMATWIRENGDTACSRFGAGDWYARQGMAHEFIAIDNARTHAHVVINHEEE